ncbi:ABC transporter substrate-binding protein [Salinibacterium sp. ZJ450]|uniref:ABC transporter substrate-binding protein n=1 Tax=Salinibacterium sp. ZJ450 TaxID=2708338 RepID=UPI00142248BB|nr:ABC transporter substrate-binding protein [Salinibacterium sp. ZJ450]
MHKAKKRIAVALVAAFSITTLAACGASGGDSAAGSGDDTIKIGVLTALSGPSAIYGDAITQGARLAAEEINAEGGVEGFRFELIEEDHANNPDSAVTAAQKMLTVDRAHALLSSFTAPTLAVRPMACEREIPVLNGGAIGADLIGQECLYNTVANTATMYPLLMDYAVDELDASKVAVIAWNDEAGGAVNTEATSSCKRLGCEVVAQESHDVGATDLSVQLARIKSAKPDMLVVGSWGDDLGYIISGAHKIGLDIPIVGSDYTPNVLTITGPEAIKSYSAILDRFDPSVGGPHTGEFVEAYKAKFDEEPTQFAANYYEHVKYVYADAVRRAVKDGKNPTESGVLLASIEALVADSHEFKSLYGESMIIRDDGTVAKPVSIYRVEDGVLAPIAEFAGSK